MEKAYIEIIDGFNRDEIVKKVNEFSRNNDVVAWQPMQPLNCGPMGTVEELFYTVFITYRPKAINVNPSQVLAQPVSKTTNFFSGSQKVTEEKVVDTPPQEKNNFLGSGWVKGKTVSISMADGTSALIQNDELNFISENLATWNAPNGNTAKFVRNQKKKSVKSPDFYIFESEQ